MGLPGDSGSLDVEGVDDVITEDVVLPLFDAHDARDDAAAVDTDTYVQINVSRLT